jgi:SAM-dependent methyltransferase
MFPSHILQRDIAWAVAPYPCVGQFRFLSLNLYRHPLYSQVLQRVKSGSTFLDLGCCVGQDVRKLVFDGAPSENIYGSDLFAGYIDVGYQLFLDKDTCKAKFFAADIFDKKSQLKDLEGKMDVVHAGLFLHLFNWKEQVAVAARIISLMYDRPGSLFLGSQVGGAEAGERDLQSKTTSGKPRVAYLHDPESFRRFWNEVAALTGTSWKVDVTATALHKKVVSRLDDDGKKVEKKAEETTFFGADTTWLRFSVERA